MRAGGGLDRRRVGRRVIDLPFDGRPPALESPTAAVLIDDASTHAAP
jgi:hypothetical protein